MVWEVVFMLVLLKIPLIYLCMVVWWAIRAEPREEQPAVASRLTDTPVSPAGRRRSPRTQPGLGGRRGARTRLARRSAVTRGRARR
jgi:hypothetical protein